MEPIRNVKREVSSLAPYRFTDGTLQFYLQMRDEHAKTNPGKFGVFGGGLESGESPHDALVREIAEELEYVPQSALYFCRFELTRVIMHLFIDEVGPDFEQRVVVREGQYGTFLTLEEMAASHLVNKSARFVLHEVADYLASQ